MTSYRMIDTIKHLVCRTCNIPQNVIGVLVRNSERNVKYDKSKHLESANHQDPRTRNTDSNFWTLENVCIVVNVYIYI